MSDTLPTIEEVLEGFGTYCRWFGYDQANNEVGEHTSSTWNEQKVHAKAHLEKLMAEARYEGQIAEMKRLKLDIDIEINNFKTSPTNKILREMVRGCNERIAALEQAMKGEK